jgi:hypothetical protein
MKGKWLENIDAVGIWRVLGRGLASTLQDMSTAGRAGLTLLTWPAGKAGLA